MSRGAKLLSPEPVVLGQFDFLVRAKELSMLVSLYMRALKLVHLACPIVWAPSVTKAWFGLAKIFLSDTKSLSE